MYENFRVYKYAAVLRLRSLPTLHGTHLQLVIVQPERDQHVLGFLAHDYQKQYSALVQ
jgi:hypothetical protein